VEKKSQKQEILDLVNGYAIDVICAYVAQFGINWRLEMQVVSNNLSIKINEAFRGNSKPTSALFWNGDNLLIGNRHGVCAYTVDEAMSALPTEVEKSGHRYHFYLGKAVNSFKEQPGVEYIAGYINRSGSNFTIKFQHKNPAEAVGELLLWWLSETK
jgi:hypothetical protein